MIKITETLGLDAFKTLGASNVLMVANTALHFKIKTKHPFSNIKIIFVKPEIYNIWFSKIAAGTLVNEIVITGVHVSELNKIIQRETKIYLGL